MGLFHKKSKWEKLIEPLSSGAPKAAAKSGLTALGTLVGMSLVSAAVSAARQRKGNE
ncbi:MAG: hypothetical protein H0T17_08960 [Propionibacteriales bacterium]|nr:hypothetical protein [Propionibacteriales bacterium]